MAKNFENEIVEISGGKLVIDNIDTGFKPVSFDEVEGVNNKVKFLNFVLDYSAEEFKDGGVLEFFFNSRIDQDEKYLNRNYSLVYGFDLSTVNKDELTVKIGDYDCSLTHMLDNVAHYCISIKQGENAVAFKVFNGFIVKYDICGHMETAVKNKQRKGSKAKRLNALMECYGLKDMDELEAILEASNS